MKYSEYLKDHDGQPSSLRLFSLILLRGLMWFNLIIALLAFVVSVLIPDKMTELFIAIGIFLLIIDTIGLGFVFIPKNWGKKIEITPFIELAKQGISYMADKK